jgi:hypothetical protein
MHVAEPAAVVLRDGGQPLQERDRLHDQVVEVEGVGRAQPRLVDAVDLGHLALVVVGGPLRGVVGGEELVLEVGDLRGDRAGRVLLRVHPEVAGDHRDQPARVVGVVDGERAAHAQVRRLAPQDPHAHRVERGHPHRVAAAPHQRVDPLLHLGRGLVGEGDRHDLAGVRVALGQQPGDAVGEHPRLARPRTRDDQQRRPRVHDGLPLARVQTLQQGPAPGGAGLGDGLLGQFEQRAHRSPSLRELGAARRRRVIDSLAGSLIVSRRVPPPPDAPALWHTPTVLRSCRYRCGCPTPVPVAAPR